VLHVDNMVCRAVSADEAGGGASLADRLVSGVMSSQVQHAFFYLIHVKQGCTPRMSKPYTRSQASFFGFARSILGGKKKAGGAGWVDNVKEGHTLQVCATAVSPMICLYLPVVNIMLCAEALA